MSFSVNCSWILETHSKHNAGRTATLNTIPSLVRCTSTWFIQFLIQSTQAPSPTGKLTTSIHKRIGVSISVLGNSNVIVGLKGILLGMSYCLIHIPT